MNNSIPESKNADKNRELDLLLGLLGKLLLSPDGFVERVNDLYALNVTEKNKKKWIKGIKDNQKGENAIWTVFYT